MATLTIRNLSDDIHARLRKRAAESGRSVEAEVRALLTDSCIPPLSDADRVRYEAAFDAAQADLAEFRHPTMLLSEELIAERRLEIWRA